MTPFSEVLIGKENVILTVKQVVMDARARRSSSLVDIIITTKNHISPSAETLMKFDSETGLMHRKVSIVPNPVTLPGVIFTGLCGHHNMHVRIGYRPHHASAPSQKLIHARTGSPSPQPAASPGEEGIHGRYRRRPHEQILVKGLRSEAIRLHIEYACLRKCGSRHHTPERWVHSNRRGK